MKYLLIPLSALPFYLLGCIPTGVMIARANGLDLTKTGSGNVGATNVARTLGKKAGIFTLLGDLGKGLIAVLLARLISADNLLPSIALVAVIAGHCFSIPGKLKGGKGVATALGGFLAYYPPAALVGIVCFFLIFAIKRIVSLSSVIAALMIPLTAVFLEAPEGYFYTLCICSLIVVYRHKENLVRLSRGEEKAFSFKKA